ncbi:MAG: hypothetical protein ACREJ2_18170 [Planctomycetota bacterium]
MPWPDRISSGEPSQAAALPRPDAFPVPAQPPQRGFPFPNVNAPEVLRALAGVGSTGAAFDIDPTPLDDGVQTDPGPAAGWRRIERVGGWHPIVGGPITLRSNDLVFLQRDSVARLTLAMPSGQPARDVWLAVGWQLGLVETGGVYTLGRPAFDDAGWRARQAIFLNNVDTLGGDFWLGATGSGTGAAYDTWADPETGDGCAIKLGAMDGVGVFDQIRLWMRGGCYNAAVEPTVKDIFYPPTGKPVPATRLFVLSNIDPQRNTPCE